MAQCTEVAFQDFDGSIDDPTWFLERLETISVALSGDTATESVTMLYPLYIATFIWGIVFLVYILLSAIPLSCARCCCTTKCCRPKVKFQVTGYPASGCDGYGVPTFFWFLLWIGLVLLVVLFPFLLGDLFTSVGTVYCVVQETQTRILGLLDTYNRAFENVLDSVDSTIEGVRDNTVAVLDELKFSVAVINDTLTGVSDSLREGCANITSSQTYIDLQQLAGVSALNFECDDLALDTATSQQVAQINSELDSAESQVLTTIADVQTEISSLNGTDLFGDIINEVASIFDSILSAFDDQSVNLGPLTNNIAYTLTEVYAVAGQNFRYWAALVCVFTELGLLFWIMGVLIFLCSKCASNKKGTNSRAQEVRCTCCGRCLTKTGCISSTFGAFILCFVSIVFLAISPVFQDVIAFYYVVPASLDSTEFTDFLRGLEKSGLITLDDSSYSLLQNITDAVDGCFFGDGGVNDALSTFGFDVNSLFSSFDVSQLNISQYGDITQEIDSAKTATADAQAALTSELFTTAQLDAADQAATYCCNYTALFSIFVDDCNDPTSECGVCSAMNDCTSGTGTPCSPGPTDNGGTSLSCKELAMDAMNVMQTQNDLLNTQSAKLDTITQALTDVENQDPVGIIQFDVDTAFQDIKTNVASVVDSLSCSELATVYYGVYDLFLKPSADALTIIAIIVTLIIAVTCVLVYVGICVNVRLGNDGIDLNNVQRSVIQSVNSVDVAIEMTEPRHGRHDLPVAEPISASNSAYSVATDEYGKPQNNDDKNGLTY